MSQSPHFAPPAETRREDFGKLFLSHPDLFPARQAGEPWGRSSLVVDFAGGPYGFSGLSEGQHRELSERFGELVLLNDQAASILTAAETTPIRIFKAAPSELKEFDVRGWSYTFDRDYQDTAVRVAGLQFMARIDFDGHRRGTAPGPHQPTGNGIGKIRAALWTPLDEGPVFLAQVENFFRLLVAYRLLELGGVLFHSAGVVSDQRGFLFMGHSGAGKTTISRCSLATGRQVLSDDMNALCPLGSDPGSGSDPGAPAVEKLPFAGDLGRTPTARQRYPLAGLYRLKKGADAIRPVRRSQAVAFLIGCAPFVNADPHRLDRLTDNLLHLLDGFPMSELTFSIEGDFWRLLEADAAERESSKRVGLAAHKRP